MQLNNIQLNKEIKSYPKLCAMLGEKKRTSPQARNSHLKDIARFVRIDKINNSYFIREIYGQPLRKKKRDAFYDDAERILMHLLANAPLLNGSHRVVQLTRNNLLINLGYVNENFKVGNSNQKETSEILGVSKYATQEYFAKTYDKARKRVDSLLRKMKDHHNISYTLDTMVCDIEGVHRKPTVSERQQILNFSKQVLNAMNLKNMTAVRLTNRHDDYNRRLGRKLETLDISYVYECYDIIIADDYIQQIKEEYQRTLQGGELVDSLKERINTLSINSGNDSTTRIYGKLLAYEIEDGEDEHIQILKDTFINDSETLFDVCTNIKSKRNLKKEIEDHQNKTALVRR